MNTGTRPIYAIKCRGKGLQELTTIAIGKTENHPNARIIITGELCELCDLTLLIH